MACYTWDEAKRKRNFSVHGLDFANAATVIEQGNSLTMEDMRYHYNERRYLTLGFFQGREVAVIYTERNNGKRIISFRKATRKERKALLEALC